jgi:hypothetical protein
MAIKNYHHLWKNDVLIAGMMARKKIHFPDPLRYFPGYAGNG